MNVKYEIKKEIKEIIKMIENEDNNIKIEEKRKKLDELLQKYIRDLWE